MTTAIRTTLLSKINGLESSINVSLINGRSPVNTAARIPAVDSEGEVGKTGSYSAVVVGMGKGLVLVVRTHIGKTLKDEVVGNVVVFGSIDY